MQETTYGLNEVAYMADNVRSILNCQAHGRLLIGTLLAAWAAQNGELRTFGRVCRVATP